MSEHQEVTCASAILVNAQGHILFQQRDNKPDIAFPNYWALPGGHVEAGETPEEAIARELHEEIGYTGAVRFWTSYDFWKTPAILTHQYIYVGTYDVPNEAIRFTEGQAMRYLSGQDLISYQIAFGFDELCKQFFQEYSVW